MRVLLIEDSDRLRAATAQGLREAGYAVDTVADGRQGLTFALTSDYDLIILDLMLPSMDGLSILGRIRDKGIRSCILILTARDTIDDRVLGLRSGADDYLVKPFAFAELLARVQALVRRVHGVPSPTIRVGPLELNTAAKTVRLASDPARPIDLPPREYALLEYLAHRAGKPVSRAELEEHLYDGSSQVLSNAIDVAVSVIRSRLDAAGCPPLIHTRRKIGYVLSAEPPS